MTPPSDPQAVVRSVHHALSSSPAFQRLDDATRTELTNSLSHIGAYMGMDPTASPPALSLAEPPGRSTSPQPTGTTGRVGEVARATLNAIDFPSFVSSLIKGSFQAIVDATIQQMEAYSTLLQEVAKTVDDYMEDNVSEDAAKDYLVDRYSDVFVRDTTGGTPSLEVNRSDPTAQLPSFFSNMGFDSPAQIDPRSVDEVIVPAARKTIAEQRHQTLATMVLLGLNRIVVDDGEINAKLEFHIDASETTALTFDSTQTNIGNMAGVSGGAQFSGQGIMVNTMNANTQSDINVRADLTGEVRIRFSSDVMPLERFADSNAIQLINQHATVPPPPSRETSDDGDTSTQQAMPSSAAATGTSIPVTPSTTPFDPWSPRR